MESDNVTKKYHQKKKIYMNNKEDILSSTLPKKMSMESARIESIHGKHDEIKKDQKQEPENQKKEENVAVIILRRYMLQKTKKSTIPSKKTKKVI